MPTREKLESALRNAHKAGDTAAAKKLANAIKGGNFEQAPAAPAEPAPEVTAPEQKQPEDLSIFRDLDSAFMKIPGAPALAEFASAANRSVFDMVDFLGPDTVNAVLELAGSERRMPTARETFGSEGGYMEEGLGRDVVQEAGEVAPMAVAFGQLLRTAAGRLPAFSQGESAGRGVARQMGQSTASQDAAAGALAGAGGEVGQEVGGDTGRMIGSVVGASATALPSMASAMRQPAAANKALREAVPTVDRLKDEARKIYTQLDEAGVTVNQPAVARLADDIAAAMKQEGFNPRIHPKVSAVLDEVASSGEKAMTISEMDIMRRVAQSAARSLEPDEARLGRIMMQKIDDFLDNVPGSSLQGAEGTNVGALFKEARGFWGQAKKGEMIQQAVEKAKNQASGFENGIRTQFRALLNNPKKMRGFSDAEKDAMKQVVRGGPAENILKAIGKFGFTEGQASSMLLSSLGSAGGFAVAGTAGGVAVPVAGQLAKSAAQKLTRDNARVAADVIAAGADGRKIALAYIRNVPKSERNIETLTGLLLNPGVNLDPAKSAQSKLISEAALAASLIRAAVPTDEGESGGL